MIKRLSDTNMTKPLRKHLEVKFQVCKQVEFVGQVYDYLISERYNPEISRAIVFVKSRKKSEDYSEDFNKILSNQSVKIEAGFFHAGMDSEARTEIYEKFKEGKVSILFATKAFGMGMNIPNIHFLFHFQPSSSFEDFLQEVGRAGRNKSAYEQAGFGDEKRIRTICFFEKEDFSNIRDLMKKSQLGWNDVKAIFGIVNEYYAQFRPLEPDLEKPLPLPLNLLQTHPAYLDNQQAGTVFRLALYWLEQLGRYELTYFTPSFFEFSSEPILDEDIVSEEIKDTKQQMLYNLISKTYSERFEGKTSVLVDVNKLYKIVDRKNLKGVMNLIIQAQNNSYVRLLHKIKLELTELRADQIKHYNFFDDETKPCLIEAFFGFIQSIIQTVPKFGKRSFDNQYLNTIAKSLTDEYFTFPKLSWHGQNINNEDKKRKKIEKEIIKGREDFSKRIKHAFWLVNHIPKIRHESIIDHEEGEVIQIVYNNDKNQTQLKWLNALKTNLYKFIFYFKNRISEGRTVFEIIEAVIESKIQPQSIADFEVIITLLKKLGYLKFRGGLIPMSLELYLKSITPVNEAEINSTDAEIFEQFNETIRLKKLRLAALETFAYLPNEEKQNNFIQEYFQCENSSQIVNLLVDYVDTSKSSIISEFREEALKKAEERLNPEQSAVYNAPINQNISVIAGPGSGKTHTLTLRVARLIQKENINPSNILILAYNRAVVLELKERLLKLFSKLGYRRLTYSLKVFTFHGLIKYSLQEKLTEDFSFWEDSFISEFDKNQGFIKARLGTIKYIFVDEFQDITDKRLEILKRLTDPQITNLTIIGDPNQSIYGFDRVSDGSPRNPKPYYDSFNTAFKPAQLVLVKNYRSYPKIIETAERILKYQSEIFDIAPLECVETPLKDWNNYVKLIDVEGENNVTWWQELQGMIDAKQFGQIAIMVRTNAEIFRAYEKIKKLNLNDTQVRIQGEGGSFIRSREISYFLNDMKLKIESEIPINFLQQFEKRKKSIIEKQQAWSKFFLDVLHALVHEFDRNKSTESTYGELIEFIKDFTKKDDGQLYQIYQNKREELNFQERREIVLTTMHRVKGLEFDAVVVLPSFAELPYAEKPPFSQEALIEIFDEEIRLLYVAYSRAKRFLAAYVWKREKAILKKKIFSLDDKEILGHPVKTGIDKFILFTLAKESVQKFLLNKVMIGDYVTIRKNHKGNWEVKINNRFIGYLSKFNLEKRKELQGIKTNNLSGFYITSMMQYNLDESLKHDSEKGKNYSDNWDYYCKKQGWILIPDFSGYGK